MKTGDFDYFVLSVFDVGDIKSVMDAKEAEATGTARPSPQTAPIYGYVENSEEFAGNYVFEDGKLSKYLFDGGYIDIASGDNTAAYRFYVRDHLGSVRVVLDDDGNVLQQLYYHPFGGVWGDVGTNAGLQPWKYSGKEYDHRDGLDLYDYGARLYDPAAVRWTSPDPLCEKYYHISPYAFCNNNPIKYVDPDGRAVFMLFYTQNNGRGDEMFRSAAETRKYDIEHSDNFDPKHDIVLLKGIEDLASISDCVEDIVDEYSDTYGQTAEFSIWSHAGIGGPAGTENTSSDALDRKQMTLGGWGKINFNWQNGAVANFFGCRTGVASNYQASFSTRVSALGNFRNVSVYGQTSYAYPSTYVNLRANTHSMVNGAFSYPTYMVGASRLGLSGRFFPTISKANAMRKSYNGRGAVNGHYQKGIKYK